MKNRYDYSAHRWRTLQRTSRKQNLAEDIDGNRWPLSNFRLESGPDYSDLHPDWALLGAIACHAQTPEDFADARYWLGGIPAELKRRMWDSLPDEVKRGLREVETQERTAA